jgi:hypothetical protein
MKIYFMLILDYTYYSLRSILLATKMDVFIIKMSLHTSIFVPSNMNRRESYFLKNFFKLYLI